MATNNNEQPIAGLSISLDPDYRTVLELALIDECRRLNRELQYWKDRAEQYHKQSVFLDIADQYGDNKTAIPVVDDGKPPQVLDLAGYSGYRHEFDTDRIHCFAKFIGGSEYKFGYYVSKPALEQHFDTARKIQVVRQLLEDSTQAMIKELQRSVIKKIEF